MISFLFILAVGFFLGMRHATDPDHVIAVTTIVSNQRNSLRAVLIGAFWGVGHTLTIFVVGAGIILFNLVIPMRLGLSVELSVAVMLIVLGLMNVAGFLRSMPGGSSTLMMERKSSTLNPTVARTTSITIRMLTIPKPIRTRPTTRRWRGWTGYLAGSYCINIFGRSWWAWFTDLRVQRLWPCSSSLRYETSSGRLPIC